MTSRAGLPELPQILEYTIPGEVVPMQPGRVLSNGKTQTSFRARAYRIHAKYHTLLHVRRFGWEATEREQFSATFRLFLGNLRTIDCDNAAKNLLDALKRVAFPDDSQVLELHVYKMLDRERPRVEVAVRRMMVP